MSPIRILVGTLSLLPSCHAFTTGFTLSITPSGRPSSTTRASRLQRSAAVSKKRHNSEVVRLSGTAANSDQDASVPEVLRQANLKAHHEVWESRRGMARGTLSAAKACRGVRESLAGPPGASKEDTLAADGKGALIVSAVGLAIAAATLRVGGRAALMSVRTHA